jgi:hypothetical protein
MKIQPSALVGTFPQADVNDYRIGHNRYGKVVEVPPPSVVTCKAIPCHLDMPSYLVRLLLDEVQTKQAALAASEEQAILALQRHPRLEEAAAQVAYISWQCLALCDPGQESNEDDPACLAGASREKRIDGIFDGRTSCRCLVKHPP